MHTKPKLSHSAHVRVLQLISSSGFYGADNVLIEIAKGLHNTPFLPIVGVFDNIFNPHLEVAEEAKRNDLVVATFPCSAKLDPKTMLSIRKCLADQNINIIHTHGYKSNLYALGASAGKNIPKICTCHNWLGDDPKMKFYSWLDKFMLNRFDAIVVVSDSVKKQILNQHAIPEKITTIFNGINIDRFNNQKNHYHVRQQLGIGKDLKVIGTVGRLSEEKGHIHLLNAAETILKHHPDVVFLIVGDGPLRRDLEAKASQLDNTSSYKAENSQNRLIFAGVRNDMPSIYAVMDLFVLPSLTEGLPMVLLEAMASQKPIVSTSVGAISSVIEDGLSGLLTQPGDSKGLADATMDLLSHPSKGKRLAQHARQTVVERFSSRAMVAKYLEIYQKVLGLGHISECVK